MVSPSHRLHAIGRLHLHRPVVRHQAAMIRAQKIAPLRLGDGAHEPLERVGEDHRGAVLVEPVQLTLGDEEHAAQDQGLHPLRVGDGVGQSQGRAPGAAEHRPLLDADLLAQPLDVLDQLPGVVVLQHRVGAGAAAAALVEQHHPPLRRVEEAPHGGVDRAARAAVQDHARLAVGATALLVVDLVLRRPWASSRRRRAPSPGTGRAGRAVGGGRHLGQRFRAWETRRSSQSIRTRFTSSGFSCCVQWPEPIDSAARGRDEGLMPSAARAAGRRPSPP